MKVLIADDATEIRFLHGEIVESCGREPVFASDGEEAWEVLCGPDAPRIALPTRYVGMPIDITSRLERERSIRLACYRAIVDLAETRDDETGRHLKRVAEYSRLLAEQLGMPKKFVEDIALFAPFHDIGKVGIPDSILLAPRKLTEEEFEAIKTHTILGYDILKDATTLEMAAEIAHTHHEKYNGAGYPRGIGGSDIPLAGRIVGLVDVYDALRTRRPYKEPWPHRKVIELIRSESGAHFDPGIVQTFAAVEGAFETIFEQWREQAEESAELNGDARTVPDTPTAIGAGENVT